MEKAWKIRIEFNKITPHILMRRLKINYSFAEKICEKISLRAFLEARNLVKELNLENEGFPAQLQKVASKNLEKFNKNRKTL